MGKEKIIYIPVILVMLVLMAYTVYEAPIEKKEKIKVLIVDGINNHDWQRATKIIKSILEESNLFSVEVSTSPPASATQEAWAKWQPNFQFYNVVFSNFNSGHKPEAVQWPKNIQNSLENFVQKGGGLVIFHAANNSFLGWEEYNKMIALGWRDKEYGQSFTVDATGKVISKPVGQGRNPGHGPEHDFSIDVRDTLHPIYKGIPLHWKHPHEQLTHGQHGPGGMQILSSAFSKDTGENEPMDWTVNYGKGRVYTTMLGHLWQDGTDTALRCVGFQTLLIRGVEWAGTGKVTYAVPSNFPTEQEIKLNLN